MVEKDGYDLLHEHSFDYCLANGLDIEISQADEAIGAILYAISRNPSGFQRVVEPNVHLAKLVARPRDGLPSFRLFFRLNQDKRRVDLLYIDHG